MEEAAKRFARRVLIIHLVLLVVVIGVVFFASGEVYHQTREQVIKQAEVRQSILAQQTGKGLQAFYGSIFNDLDLLRQAPADDPDDGGTGPTTQQTAALNFDLAPFFRTLMGDSGGNVPGIAHKLLANILWKQLDRRVSHLFRVDRDRLAKLNLPPPMPATRPTAAATRPGAAPPPTAPRPTGTAVAHPAGAEPRPNGRPGPGAPGGPPVGPRLFAGPGGFGGGPRDRDRDLPPRDRDPFRERDRNPILLPLSPVDPRFHPREIVIRSFDWLKSVERPEISPFEQFDVDGDKVGLNLVAVPTPEKNRLIVAAVPIKHAQQRFIEELNKDGDSTNAVLVDETGTIMVGTHPQLAGRNVSQLHDRSIAHVASDYVARPRKGVEIIDHPYTLGGQEFPPGLMAVEPVSIAGKKWTLMIITPLSDVDMVVSRVFKRAIFWAVFVVCSMTAILVSSSVQLIRGRIRLERVRNEVLTRELRQAREIQLAWLPRQGVTVPALDIAAINHPASHISGDFYNWFELPDGRTVVTIGDVTGHGMSAAFLMATTQLLVHTTMLRIQDPGQTLGEVNKQLCLQVFNGQFVTMLICVLDLDAGSIEVATAGHYPPVLGQNGHYDELPVEPQLVLGVERDTKYPTEVFSLPSTASLVLYTDGVIDAKNPKGQRFELFRLLESLGGQGHSAQDLVNAIVGQINQFRGARELPDDLTLVCIQTQSQNALREGEPLPV